MKQTEMQSLVDSLAKQRKQHLDQIENTTIKDLKEMVSTHLGNWSLEEEELCAASEDQGRARGRGALQEVMGRWQPWRRLFPGAAVYQGRGA